MKLHKKVAEELVDKFLVIHLRGLEGDIDMIIPKEIARQCAITHVDGILSYADRINREVKHPLLGDRDWKKVRQELEKL